MPRQINYYNFIHDEVNKKFSGELTFCNSFCVKDEYAPVAVYKAKKPDKSKGHKKYLLLQVDDKGLLIRGMDSKDMKKWRYQDAIECVHCEDIVFSVNRHDYRNCKCGKIAIDGGKDYTKISFQNKNDYILLTLDLISGKIVEVKG